MIVVDASAVVELLLRSKRSHALLDVLPGVVEWHAPHLLDVEVMQTLRRFALDATYGPEAASASLAVYHGLGILRHSHQPLAGRIWSLRQAMTAYDASYVALSEALDAPLWTADGRLARAHGHRAEVRLI